MGGLNIEAPWGEKAMLKGSIHRITRSCCAVINPRLTHRLAVMILLAVMPATTSNAQTLRYAFQTDVATLDPHALNEVFTLGFLGNFYEGLVRRAPDLSIEPALAERWEIVEPTRWRFFLRRGVKFHNGDRFGADDVIFSADRARQEGSNVKQRLAGVVEIIKVDPYTVDIITETPMPTLLSQWDSWYIVSKVWAEANNATAPVDFRSGTESYAASHVNGTGPFRLKTRRVDVKTVAEPNPDWWDKPVHNLTQVTFTPISTDATRVAALLSGEVDMIYPLPVQDINRVRESPNLDALLAPELRTMFVGMNQSAEAGGPFADRRVRRALYLAIDVGAIKDVVMRGMSVPTGEMVAPEIEGADPVRFPRPAYDPDTARELLKEAGFAEGFRIQLDCPNNRYVNDEEICEAIVQMAAKVGIEMDLVAQPRSKFFEKVLSRDTNLYLLGWTPATLDSLNPIRNLHSCTADFNLGGYCNPKVDALADRIRRETDPAQRRDLVGEAWQLVYDDIAYIPLHQQMLAWGVRRGVEVTPRADNVLDWRNVRVMAE